MAVPIEVASHEDIKAVFQEGGEISSTDMTGGGHGKKDWGTGYGSLLMALLLLSPEPPVRSVFAAGKVALGVTAPPLDLDYGLSADQTWEAGELVGETVNLLNGNVIESSSDLGFPSPNRLGLSFARAYNSRSTVFGPLGHGWTHTYSVILETGYSIGRR